MQIQEEDFVQYLTIKKRLAPKTIDTYRIRFLVIKRWLVANNAELTNQTFESFLYKLKEQGLGNSALNTYINTAHQMESFSKDRGLSTGFTEGIESLPKTHPDIVILSVDEIEKLLSTHLEYRNRNGVDCSDLDRKYLTLTNFIAITGCRFEEAASLQIKKLDISNGRATLVNTKNRDNRYVYFDGEIKQELEYLIKGRNLESTVFTNSRGTHVKPAEFNDDLRARAKKAGITKYVHAHLLRHSAATHWVMAGVDISIVATLLGHRDIKTTYETYVHLADEALKRAAMRSPLLRKSVDPREIIKLVESTINGLRLDSDERFIFSLSKGGDNLSFNLSVK